MIIGVLAGQGGTPTPPVGCAYPLGATEAEVTGFGFNGRLTLSNSDQTGTYTANGTNRTFGAFPANPLSPANIDFTSGNKVVEFVCTPSQLTGAGSSRVDLNFYITTLLGSTIFGGRVRCADDGTFDVSIIRRAFTVGTVNDVAVDGSGNIIIGFAMNGAAGTCAAVVQNTPVLLSNSTFTPQAGIIVFTTQEVAVAEGDVGKTFITTARTDAATITQTYAGGATDACGNTL